MFKANARIELLIKEKAQLEEQMRVVRAKVVEGEQVLGKVRYDA